MSVETRHPEYAINASKSAIVRDIYNGVDSSVQYLYKLQRESDNSLLTRKNNATLKNFVKRAVEAFVGMIFRKHIERTGFEDRFDAIFDKIDKTNNLNRFSRDLTTNLIVDGKVYVGVDTPIDGKGEPYAVIYKREQIINWRKSESGEYIMVVIEEFVEVQEDEFTTSYQPQWRVYKEDGNVDVYRKIDGKSTYIETIATEYDYIPLVAIELDEIPPLYDVTKLTIKHLNRTSIKDKYLDMAATPIPLIWGAEIDEDDGNGTKPVLVVGADNGFVFTGNKAECDFEWRELSGSSIDKLQEDLSVIEEDITTGIIRAASSDTTTIKTATQSYYEAAESANRVVVIANAIEQGLNKIVQFIADLGNIQLKDEARVIVNKDFNAISGQSDDLRLLWEVYLGGALSIETFLDSLSKYEAIDVGNVKDEIKRIESDTFVPKARAIPEETRQTTDNRTISAMNGEQQETNNQTSDN